MHDQRLRVALAAANAGAQEKLKPEEVVARHLEAVGAAEARSPQRSRVVAGGTRIEVKAGGRGRGDGH